MSTNPKPLRPGSATAMYRVAIIGAGTLKGKELAEVLPDTSFPAIDIRLLDDEETLGQLEAVGDEVTFVQQVQKQNLEHSDLVFLASEADSARKAYPLAAQVGSAVVDLSYGLEGERGSVIRSSWVERELGESPVIELQPGPVVVAHPAAVALAILLLRIRRAGGIRTAVATVFEPASERGKRGLDELHGQTVNLLSFQQLPKDVYDVQVAFNMVADYGAKASPVLAATERRILEHFRKVTHGQVLPPSLTLLQASIFHGYMFSIFIEMNEAVSLGDVAQALAGEHVEVTRTGEQTPNAVEAAGQDEIMASVRRDAENPN
ncbi:MAG TPA: Asd/ArgC dimerization domain-containing protein, partial [Terriglobales bacterium]|nr:Asd/ArgC dimerization domain-containing protein [Terriglobales bacterium]